MAQLNERGLRAMYWVIRHKVSGRIFSCKLINGYDMEYYGVKNWDDHDTALAEMPAFLKLYEKSELDEWAICEIEEMPLKMLNVKLNNNPAKRVFMDSEGKLSVETSAP
jgi:hypothetical protein